MNKIFFLIPFFFIATIAKSQHSDNIDSLKNELKATKVDTSLVLIQVEISNYYYMHSNFDSCLYYSTNALNLSKGINYKIGVIKSLNRLGTSYFLAPNLPRSLDSYLEVLKLSEEQKYLRGVGAAYANIAHVYLYVKDYTQAIEFSKKALVIFQETKDSANLVDVLLSIGSAYDENPDSALIYINRAHEIAIIKNYKTYIGVSYLILGQIYPQLKDTSLATIYLYQGARIFESVSDSMDLSTSYVAIADLYKKRIILDSAMFYGKKALTIAQNTRFPYGIINATKLLSDLYRHKNNDSAFKYLDLYILTNDSFYNENKRKEIQNMMTLENLRRLEVNNIKLEHEKERKENLQYLILAILIVVVFMFFEIIRKSKAKRRNVKSVALFGLLLFFEFVIFFIHPYLDKWSNHNQFIMFGGTIIIAFLLTRLQDKLVPWIQKIISLKYIRVKKPQIIEKENEED